MTSEPRTPYQQRALAANGQTLAITEYSTPGIARPPLLLLHGIGSRAISWWPVVDPLAAHFHLYALDLRGHGASTKPLTGYLLPDYAADLAAVIDALGLDCPRILGHSLGGLVALTWATHHPCRAAAIALEDTALRSQPETLQAFDGWLTLAALPVADAAAYYAREHPDWSPADCLRRAESITATAQSVFAELRADAEANLANGGDRIAPLANIHSPLLLLHGDLASGGMVVPDDAARLAMTLPQTRLVRVPGAGHAIHRDHPAAFLAAVIPFLAKTED
jgi:pimeloyl-ACP methyl ester carboxylesterase